jgi:chemotaxis protein MotB
MNRFQQVFGPGAIAAAGLFLATACVSQRQYDDMASLSKNYQQQLLEREAENAKLQGENDALRRKNAMSDVRDLSEAGSGEGMDSRLSELQQKIDALGRPLKDIERFDVEGGYVLMVQDKILFDSGSSELSADGKKALSSVAEEINGKPHGRIWVRGHTDNVPVSKPQTKERFPHGNLQLSAARADEVAAALISSGKVQARDVALQAFGQHDPVRPNDTAENKRLNRRVEIFVSDQSAQAMSASADRTADKASKK